MKLFWHDSGSTYEESDVTKTLGRGCPLLSSKDAHMLWKSSNLPGNATMEFLEALLIHSGIFLPLKPDSAPDQSPVYFIPSLLKSEAPRGVWTFKSKPSESWRTTLCHSWLFRDGAPSHLMDNCMLAILRDVYDFSQTNTLYPNRDPSERVLKDATGPKSENETVDSQLIRVEVRDAICWKSALMIELCASFANRAIREFHQYAIQIFVAVADSNSKYAVATETMKPGMHRLVLSGKGPTGYNAHSLWKGGYAVVLRALENVLADYSNADYHVVCPECLATSNRHTAKTWSWSFALARTESFSSIVRCLNGHSVESHLLCGTNAVRRFHNETVLPDSRVTRKKISEVLPSVVFVGLCDSDGTIRRAGSGFVVDARRGLIVTASHVLFNMKPEDEQHFGELYYGIKDAKAIIGIISTDHHNHKAVFRYFADIVVHDVHTTDACILRITSSCNGQESMVEKDLHSLSMTTHYEIEESIRIVGFNQSGQGVFEPGEHLNLLPEFEKGYICGYFDASDKSTSYSFYFAPREEIVAKCFNVGGLSGGPFVNNSGQCIGILSRGDPREPRRCYLVPASKIEPLVKKARELCD